MWWWVWSRVTPQIKPCYVLTIKPLTQSIMPSTNTPSIIASFKSSSVVIEVLWGLLTCASLVENLINCLIQGQFVMFVKLVTARVCVWIQCLHGDLQHDVLLVFSQCISDLFYCMCLMALLRTIWRIFLTLFGESGINRSSGRKREQQQTSRGKHGREKQERKHVG